MYNGLETKNLVISYLGECMREHEDGYRFLII